MACFSVKPCLQHGQHLSYQCVETDARFRVREVTASCEIFLPLFGRLGAVREERPSGSVFTSPRSAVTRCSPYSRRRFK